ncbi:MAG: hypothetical protein Fur0037_24880 [Planctomycetota bacterium]
MAKPFLECAAALIAAPFCALLPSALIPAGLPAQGQAPLAASLDLAAGIHWITDGVEFHERSAQPRPQAEPDRGALIDEACRRAAAERKLVLWYIPRIQENHLRGRQMYRAPVLDIYLRQTLFSDTDVAELIEASFVPLRMVMDEQMSARFGLRPLDFVEPAVVFLDPEGKVVHYVERFRTFRAHWFADLCARVLDRAGVKGPDSHDPDALRRRGRWAEALAAAMSRPHDDSASWLSIARLQRLLRMPEQALDSVDKAMKAKGADEGAALAEKGLILSMLGRDDEARPFLERAWRGGSPRAAQAGYLLALCDLGSGDEVSAMRRFSLVAQRYGNTPEGRNARANTLLGPDDRPFGAAFAGFESVRYLPEAAYRGFPKDTRWQGEGMEPRAMAEQGLAFLLRQQRSDGGFTDSRYAYWPNSEITPNVWTAITALACTALLDWRGEFPGMRADIDRAIERGESWMFDPRHQAREKNEESYSDGYRLLYLARKARGRSGEQRRMLIERMNEIVEQAASIQRPSGFWAHEYENAFCTGSVLWGLLAARDSGAGVPPEVLDKGAAALLSARYATGSFSYGGRAREGRPTGLKDAMGRMPVCEGALLALGRSDTQKLRFALANFWKYIENLERIRRNDFHSDGELGGFFFFHAVFHASEVVDLLPEDERAEHRARFIELLRRIPEMDGSFLDSHELGRSYGTAMALLTLRNATRRRAGKTGDR